MNTTGRASHEKMCHALLIRVFIWGRRTELNHQHARSRNHGSDNHAVERRGRRRNDKMILADDEPVIIKGLQKLVDFNRLGIEIVGEYEDGKAAFDGILTEKPDIALLDIYMPKKTGIEILKRAEGAGD